MPDDDQGPLGDPDPEGVPSEDEEAYVPGDLTSENHAEPGEEWIEEYESEQRDMRPRKKFSHPVGVAAAITLVLVLVMWTLLSPQVLPEVGNQYVHSPTLANLGSGSWDVEIKWPLNLVLIADTTWGVSVSGERDISEGDLVRFSVLVTKVSEDMKNAWFAGTSINLRKADMSVVGGPQVGSMVSESEEAYGLLAVVEARFDSAGNYSCAVTVEVDVYGKMLIGFAPVKVLRMTLELDGTLDVS